MASTGAQNPEGEHKSLTEAIENNSDTLSTEKVSIPPPGYQFLKVRKPNGTIVTVQRKITNQDVPTTSPPLSPSAVPLPVSPPGSPTIGSPSQQYQDLASRPQSDYSEHGVIGGEQSSPIQEKRRSKLRDSMIKGLGTVIGPMTTVEIGDWHADDKIVNHEDDISDDEFNHDIEDESHNGDSQNQFGEKLQSVRRSNETESDDQTTEQVAHGQAEIKADSSQHNPNGDAEKLANNVEIKDLNRTRSTADVKELPLKPHWAQWPFYGVAALSLLPLFFLLAGIFILLMNGKSVDSRWNEMEEVIKIAVSAWPIGFAAVTAQVLKSFALFKLERGIKLLRIEQLIGSNSFGSAVKQPFTLRRLDLLTLAIFAIWCLSPLGSQALQRVYIKTQRSMNDQPTLRYLNTNGQNEMFSFGANGTTDEVDFQTKMQLISVYYNAAFLPPSERDGKAGIIFQDRYGNPGISKVGENQTDTKYFLTSAYGIPLNLPNTTFDSNQASKPGDSPSREQINFVMSASYYNLTCGNWSLTTYDGLRSNMTVSNSSDFAICMTDEIGLDGNRTITSAYRPNFLAFASLNRDITPGNATNATFQIPGDTAQYSYIECTYDRVFVNVTVQCERDTSSYESTLPLCQDTDVVISKVIKPMNSTDQWLRDFTQDWIYGTTSTSANFITSTTEKFVNGGLILDDPFNRGVDLSNFNLSKTASVEEFEWYMGYAFNTWVNLGYCPECVDFNSTGWLGEFPDRVTLYDNATSNRVSWDIFVYQINHGWVAAYMICCIILFIASVMSILLEAVSVAPDVFGHASSLARESRYLHLPKTSSAMNEVDRALIIGGVEIMMQDVRADANVGRIAIGMKHNGAQRLEANRLYR